MEEDRSTRSGAFPTGYPNAEHPPLTSTEFFAQDQGDLLQMVIACIIFIIIFIINLGIIF